jgi:hypothetical protein
MKTFFLEFIFWFRFQKGIEPTGNLVDAPTKFNIETFTAGQGDVEVTIINPKGQKEPVNILVFLIEF